MNVPPDDTQPDLPTPSDPVYPAAPSAPPPAAPPPARSSRPGWLIPAIAAALVLLLGLGGVLLALSRARAAGGSTTPTAAAILASASKATLQDATFTLQGQVKIAFGPSAPPTAITINGDGSFTATPARAQAKLTIPLLGAQNAVETFLDTDAIYIRAPGLLATATGSGTTPSADATKWYKIPIGPSSSTAVSTGDLYKQITDPKLVGEDTINNKPVWHIMGTLNTTMGTPTPKATPTVTPKAGEHTMAPVMIDLWLAKDLYYPMKIQVQTTATIPSGALEGLLPTVPPGMAATATAKAGTPTPGTSDQTSTIGIDMTALFNNWNTGLKLTPPAPADVITGLPGFPTGPGFPGKPTATPTPKA